MGDVLKKLSIISRGLRYKLRIAFCLMSLIPLLVCFSYMLPDVFPNMVVAPLIKQYASLVLPFIFLWAILGFVIVKGMIDPVIKISSDVARVADGDFAYQIRVTKEGDEIGDLSSALNKLTLRIRDNMEQLRDYSAKTQEINLEINKRVIILSGLLQISELISKEMPLSEIFDIIVEKVAQLGNSTLSLLCIKDESGNDFLIKTIYGQKSSELRRKGIENIKVGAYGDFLNEIIKNRVPYVYDADSTTSIDIESFKSEFGVLNFLIFPIIMRGSTIGMLLIGNTESNFAYAKSDLELIDIFSRQIGIAIENDYLSHRIKKLEVKDALTGLYTESFIRGRLNEEIKRAISFQRPCAFLMFEIDNFKDYRKSFGDIATEAVLKKIALVLHDSITDVDKGARFADSSFALVVPEKNKRECIRVADDIRRKIEFVFSEEEDGHKRITVTGVVTENPIDGVTGDDLINKARQMLTERENNNIKNRILT